MATRPSLRTRGIVLDEMAYRESSKIIRIYSEEAGLISVMCRGAMRPRSPLLSLTQSFSHNIFDLSQGRTFYYLNRGRIIESNLDLRRDYRSMVTASLVTEIVAKSSPEGQASKKVYGLLAKTLDLAKGAKNYQALVAAFIIKYMAFMGYRPRLEVPGTSQAGLVFSHGQGGLVEADPASTSGQVLDDGEIYTLRQMLYNTLDRDFLDGLDEALSRKLAGLMLAYLSYNLEIGKLHSLTLVE